MQRQELFFDLMNRVMCSSGTPDAKVRHHRVFDSEGIYMIQPDDQRTMQGRLGSKVQPGIRYCMPLASSLLRG